MRWPHTSCRAREEAWHSRILVTKNVQEWKNASGITRTLEILGWGRGRWSWTTMRPCEKVHPSRVKGVHAWHQAMLMGAAIPITSALEAFPSCSKWAPDQRRYLESATPNVIGSYFRIHLDNFVDVSVEPIKTLGFNCQLITCSQRGSAGKQQSSCISHSPWRSSAVFSPS